MPFARLEIIPESKENDSNTTDTVENNENGNDKVLGNITNMEANSDDDNIEIPECMQTFHTNLPRNLSVIPDHMLMNRSKKVTHIEPNRRQSISDEYGTCKKHYSPQ